MKKVLSTALALGLVAGVATTASAAYDSFSVTGYYQVEGNYATNMDRDAGANIDTTTSYSSAWYYHKARLYPVLKVNDSITMKAELRMLHDDFGGGEGGGSTDTEKAGTDTFDWDKLWMEYNSPLGMIHVGTTPWGSWGTAFGNGASRQNAIKYFPPVPAPFTAVLFTGKLNENDADDSAAVTAGSATGNATDLDNDYYEARFGYKTDTLDTQLGLGFNDDMKTSGTSIQKWRLRGYAKTSVAGFNIEGEFDHTFGDTTNLTTNASQDYDAWAAYGMVSTNFDKLTVGLLGWYASGDNDASTTNDLESYGTIGNDFEPFLIATGDDYGLLQNDLGSNSYYYTNVVSKAGQIAFGGFASMPVSDKLTLSTAIGSVWADEVGQITNQINAGQEVDDHYGYEIDIKASYKLLDNLTYSVNFGYFDCGDLFEQASANTTNAQDSVVLLNHTLNMTF